jgi:hypothetical protein
MRTIMSLPAAVLLLLATAGATAAQDAMTATCKNGTSWSGARRQARAAVREAFRRSELRLRQRLPRPLQQARRPPQLARPQLQLLRHALPRRQ